MAYMSIYASIGSDEVASNCEASPDFFADLVGELAAAGAHSDGWVSDVCDLLSNDGKSLLKKLVQALDDDGAKTAEA
ncbi:MAG: hypothetical protein KGL46_03855 [Hyphomicrobiales bacterium]|nr:hypothetical protein [Hyphomicrobiales bacterium]